MYAYINSRKYKTDPPYNPYHIMCEMQSTGICCASNVKHPLPPISHQPHIIIKNEALPLSHFALHMRQGHDISLRSLPAPTNFSDQARPVGLGRAGRAWSGLVRLTNLFGLGQSWSSMVGHGRAWSGILLDPDYKKWLRRTLRIHFKSTKRISIRV